MLHCSKIDSQLVKIDQLLVPNGVYLQNSGTGPTGPNMSNVKSAFAYNLSDDFLYYNDGSDWIQCLNESQLLTMGPVGSSPNANAGTISNYVLTLQPTDGTQPGLITTGLQFIGGIKTFNDGIKLFNTSDPLMNPYYNGDQPGDAYFMQNQVVSGTLPAMVLDGGGALGGMAAWHVQKCGRMVFLALGTSDVIALGAPGNNITAPAATLPIWARPLAVVRKALCLVIENGTEQQGYVTINLDGSLEFATTVSGTGFTGVAGIADFLVCYTN